MHEKVTRNPLLADSGDIPRKLPLFSATIQLFRFLFLKELEFIKIICHDWKISEWEKDFVPWGLRCQILLSHKKKNAEYYYVPAKEK